MPAEKTGICRNCPGQINALAPNAGPGNLSVTVTKTSGTSSPVTFEHPHHGSGIFPPHARTHYSDARKGQEKGKLSAYLADGPPTYRKHWPDIFRTPGVRPGDPGPEMAHTDEKSAFRRSVNY
jgi:hypothetical protein